MPWAAAEPEPIEQKQIRLRQFRGRFDLGEDFIYGIFDSSEEEVLGGTGLHTRHGPFIREIGYWVGVQFAPTAKWSRREYRPKHLLDLKKLLTKAPRTSVRRPQS